MTGLGCCEGSSYGCADANIKQMANVCNPWMLHTELPEELLQWFGAAIQLHHFDLRSQFQWAELGSYASERVGKWLHFGQVCLLNPFMLQDPPCHLGLV